MSWNPFRKKDADKPDAEPATPAVPTVPAAADADDDDTQPIMEAGGVTERTSLIRESNGIRLEQVEVLGPGGPSDRFTRLGVACDEPAADCLRELLLTTSERLSGFRDLLISPGCALAAALEVPDTTLAELTATNTGAEIPRAADLLAALAELAEFLAATHEKYGLAWPLPGPELIGFVRSDDDVPPGLQRRHPVFTAWDQLATGVQAPAALLAAFQPAFEHLATFAHVRGFDFGTGQLARLQEWMAAIADDPELTYAALSRRALELRPAFTTHGVTDNGRKRDHNEDAWLAFQIDQASGTGNQFVLAVVADGMGGHASGEVASSLALDLLRQQLMLALLAPRSVALPTGRLTEQLETVIPSIDRALTERAQMDEAMSGMGTTMAGVAVLRQTTTLTPGGGQRLGEETAAVFNVGDSRVYCYGPGGLKRLTRDHSLVQNLIDAGSITADEAFSHPRKNVITRCLGGGDSDCTPSVSLFTPGPGEVLLIASDGLSDALRDGEIENVFQQHANAGFPALGSALVSAANAAGGPDNITVLLVACEI